MVTTVAHLQDPDVTIHHGDCLTILRGLPDESAHMCVTSPPFYGLRDYGVDGQIGLEETPDEWCARLVDVFREVRRVLRPDGTCWVEVGDSYSAGGGFSPDAPSNIARAEGGLRGKFHGERRETSLARTGARKAPPGLKPKDLVGAPWMLAFALRADGWYLRSDIIWARPNPMPESVTDRPTKAHSYVFLLAKQARYFYDADAIREPAIRAGDIPRGDHDRAQDGYTKPGWGSGPVPTNRNKRSVWSIATQPLPFDHYAAYPEKLVEPCILAGTSEHGVCGDCGAPWTRETRTSTDKPRAVEQTDQARPDGRTRPRQSGGVPTPIVETTGWRPTCGCDTTVVPATILDPFLGSGTTALVARRHNRRCVGIELNQAYCELAAGRLAQQSLLALEADA